MEKLEVPPNKEAFEIMSPDKQLEELSRSWNRLTVKLDSMNRRTLGTILWIEKTEAYYEQKNKEEMEKTK